MKNTTDFLDDILIFIYFNVKNLILGRIFPKSDFKINPLYSLGISLVMVWVNNILWSNYNTYLNLTYIKGSLRFPSFTLLIILADFIATVLFFIIEFIRHLVMDDWKLLALFDFFRLLVLHMVFTLIVSAVWYGQVSNQKNFDFTCFKNQLAIDYAVYYYRNDRIPERLPDFTSYTTNPYNNSRLIFKGDTLVSLDISDESGNKLLSIRDLTSLDTYKKDPSKYFRVYGIMNKNVCGYRLFIPPEFIKPGSR